jgi:flagellar hook protein FlgE
MIGALWNGISGMNAYTNALTAESNNVANINTVGYKADTVSFADLAYTDGVGKGTNASAIDKNFNQGNLKITGGDYDLAINGKGFFTAYDTRNEEVRYTRAGNFRIGNDGKLQMPNGFNIYGISTGTTPSIVSSDPTVTRINSSYTQSIASQIVETSTEIKTINAKSTDFQASAVASGTSGTDYKTADAKIADAIVLTTAYTQALSLYGSNPVAGVAPVAQVSSLAYNSFATDLTKQGDYIEVLVDGNTIRQSYDTDAQTTMNLFADKISKTAGIEGSVDSAGTVTITSLIPGKEINIASPKINSQSFIATTTTAASLGTGMANVTALRTALSTAIQNAGGEFIDITNNIDLTATQITDLQLKLDTLNISDNQFGDPEIDNGVIYLKQGENKFVVGKVTVHAFTDQTSLVAEGDNVYSKTEAAGEPINMAGISTVLGGSLELSNSQLSEGLVNLMVYQRAFEANSKLFAAADDFLNIAIQLKK